MSKITGNENAFPFHWSQGEDYMHQDGMTLRQYYAGQQMAACRQATPHIDSETLADQALRDTDALIAALNKTPQ